MKDTLYSYTARSDYDRDYTVKGQTIRCYSPQQMNKLYPEGGYRTVGEALSKSGAGKKALAAKNGTLVCGNVHAAVTRTGYHSSALYSVAGYVRVGADTFVALLKPRFAWIPWVFFILVFAALLVLINFHSVLFPDDEPEPGIIDPVYDPEDVDPGQTDWEDPNDKTATLTDYVLVKIPLGTVQFLYDFSGVYPDGPVHISLAIEVDGAGYALAVADTQIIDGKIPDTELDWDIIRTELVAGTYVGSLNLYAMDDSGNVAETYSRVALPVKIVQVNTGSISLTYSDEVTLNLATGAIQVDYRHSGNATHNCILQLVLDDGDTPYVIATSGVITPGHRLTQMTLDPAYTTRLRPGTYKGRLRVNYFSDESTRFNFNTDIVVTITVKQK